MTHSKSSVSVHLFRHYHSCIEYMFTDQVLYVFDTVYTVGYIVVNKSQTWGVFCLSQQEESQL